MAMTRQQILAMQMVWHQASDAVNTRGELVWFPLGRDPKRWQFVAFGEHSEAGDGVTCRDLYGHWACECREGRYYGTSVAGADADHRGVTTLSGFVATETNGFRYWYSNGPVGEYVEFTVPDGTESFWVLGVPNAGNHAAAAVTVTNGTRLEETLDFTDTGDFAGATYRAECMEKFVKVAENFTVAGTVRITYPGAGTAPIRIVGAIAVKSAPSNPLDGVFDPDSLVRVCARDAYQIALGPVKFGYGASGEKFFGHGHWSSDYGTNQGTLTGEAMSRVYGASDTAWNPAADVWAEAIATRYASLLKGTIKCADAGLKADLGQYRGGVVVSPGGVQIHECLHWNTNADDPTVDVQIAAASAGYCGQWSLDPGWQRFRMLPDDPAPWGYVCTGADGFRGDTHCDQMAAYRGNLVALFTAGSSVGGGQMKLHDYPTYKFPKLYREFSAGARQDVVEGDMTMIGQQRAVTDRGGLEPILSRRRA